MRLSTFPLAALRLSRGKRLLIVALSYGLGVLGLWFLFPLVHNGASMFLPIVAACWLFRYRGMLISLVLNGIAFQLTYTFLLRGELPDHAFVEGGVLGFGTSLVLGLVVCWLRTAVDLIHEARQQALIVEQERLWEAYLKGQVTLAYEQQRKINEAKDQFLLNVNHELRTPLMVLGSALELLEEDLGQEREALTLARENHEELVNLVGGVLDAVTITEGTLVAQPEVVPVRQIVQEELAQSALANIQAYTIHLQITDEIMVWADPQYLRQVLRNLLSNVFKYVPTQTEIRIEATSASPSSPVCLSVQDAGPGIPSEEMPLVFEKFVRLKRDLAGTTPGTGLGLYICRQLVEAMGGRIWVESTGEGSRFCMVLPTIQ